jgi:hypothetical protein
LRAVALAAGQAVELEVVVVLGDLELVIIFQ